MRLARRRGRGGRRCSGADDRYKRRNGGDTGGRDRIANAVARKMAAEQAVPAGHLRREYHRRGHLPEGHPVERPGGSGEVGRGESARGEGGAAIGACHGTAVPTHTAPLPSHHGDTTRSAAHPVAPGHPLAGPSPCRHSRARGRRGLPSCGPPPSRPPRRLCAQGATTVTRPSPLAAVTMAPGSRMENTIIGNEASRASAKAAASITLRSRASASSWVMRS